MRSINPNVKLMAAVGGWNFGSTVFSHIAASPELRARFASNVAEFLAQWKFDGEISKTRFHVHMFKPFMTQALISIGSIRHREVA